MPSTVFEVVMVFGRRDTATRPPGAGLVSSDGRTTLVPVHLHAGGDAQLPEAAADLSDAATGSGFPQAPPRT
ncbi:hypothetical protein [Actinomadura sp. KC216]|uniref:hypothetical protein n=1 Tax=Actinomadura sp. KC216 TaxID=2530370 RepID=UPI001404F46E|nr:hypothetical protein [Actinomadura sp. KC216]